MFQFLVARIAQPTWLAIWHRGRLHRRPNRSESPNCKRLMSIEIKAHDFSHRSPTSQDFRKSFCGVFPGVFVAFSCNLKQAKGFSHCWRKSFTYRWRFGGGRFESHGAIRATRFQFTLVPSPQKRFLKAFLWLGMPKCRWDIGKVNHLTSRRQHDQHKQSANSLREGHEDNVLSIC